MNTRELIEKCRDALAEELGAWDIDPPLFHVKEAHDACVAWLAAPAAPAPVPLRWEGAKGDTIKEMRANLSRELYAQGDTVLIWANEGDLVSLNMRAAIAASKGGAA